MAIPGSKAWSRGFSTDMLIAARALAEGTTLVTANEGEFARVEGLDIEKWAA
jgi:predicted nucleic acid-binding protein